MSVAQTSQISAAKQGWPWLVIWIGDRQSPGSVCKGRQWQSTSVHLWP